MNRIVFFRVTLLIIVCIGTILIGAYLNLFQRIMAVEVDPSIATLTTSISPSIKEHEGSHYSIRKKSLFPNQGNSDMANLHPAFIAQEADTYVVAEFTFDGISGPDSQGWTSIDITTQIDSILWHVDDFMVPAGGDSKAMWCGARQDSIGPLCSYQCLPGYVFRTDAA